jgi:NTE family protein
MNRETLSVTTLMVWVVLFMAINLGCAHYPLNQRLEKFDMAQVSKGTAFRSPNRSDDLFLVLAFSGGGTRAAALAYGVLEGLAQVEVSPPSHPSSSDTENQVKKKRIGSSTKWTL